MGHKVHPTIHRTQVIFTWDSRWFSKKNYAAYAAEDIAIREYVKKACKDAHVDAVSVERAPNNLQVTIIAAKPGFIIGRSGQGLETIRKHIERQILHMQMKVKLNIRELKSPSLSAAVTAQTIAEELERRMPFRRVIKQAISRVRKAGALGVKVKVSGRLNGAEIARTEGLLEGKVPLITLRSHVDYAVTEANTMYGKIGVKVWIYKGDVFGRFDKFAEETTTAKSEQGRRAKED